MQTPPDASEYPGNARKEGCRLYLPPFGEPFLPRALCGALDAVKMPLPYRRSKVTNRYV